MSPSALPRGAAEDLVRAVSPGVLGTLARRWGDFTSAEDAVQDAIVAALERWEQTPPDDPRGWLLRVAERRLVDAYRSSAARERRERLAAAALAITDGERDAGTSASDDGVVHHDDTLTVLYLCCHPALSSASSIALTLRAAGGLSTSQIAAAFLVPEATMAQRISRAKHRLREQEQPFAPPPSADRPRRLRLVRHVLYLMFSEGYTSTAGTRLHTDELTTEAIRLTRRLHRMLPSDADTTGLLALMLLTDARRAARTGAGRQ